MKLRVIGPILVCLLVASTSLASVNGPFLGLSRDFTGAFQKAKEIYFFSYPTQSSCTADEGQWDSEIESCYFSTYDEVQVKKVTNSLYDVEVNTIGTNGHSCTFSATASPLKSNSLRAAAQATVIDESGEWQPATCEVFLYYVGSSISVEDNGNCREYCGARAQLYIEGARKK